VKTLRMLRDKPILFTAPPIFHISFLFLLTLSGKNTPGSWDKAYEKILVEVSKPISKTSKFNTLRARAFARPEEMLTEKLYDVVSNT
jgi:hypothetical protein